MLIPRTELVVCQCTKFYFNTLDAQKLLRICTQLGSGCSSVSGASCALFALPPRVCFLWVLRYSLLPSTVHRHAQQMSCLIILPQVVFLQFVLYVLDWQPVQDLLWLFPNTCLYELQQPHYPAKDKFTSWMGKIGRAHV